MAVVDPATLGAVDAVSRRRGLARSGIIGEILADWAGKKDERAWPNSNLDFTRVCSPCEPSRINCGPRQAWPTPCWPLRRYRRKRPRSDTQGEGRARRSAAFAFDLLRRFTMRWPAFKHGRAIQKHRVGSPPSKSSRCDGQFSSMAFRYNGTTIQQQETLHKR